MVLHLMKETVLRIHSFLLLLGRKQEILAKFFFKLLKMTLTDHLGGGSREDSFDQYWSVLVNWRLDGFFFFISLKDQQKTPRRRLRSL
jgi:hypothetical protein